MSLNQELSSIKAFLLFGDDDQLKLQNFKVISHVTVFLVMDGLLFAKGL